jgi:adenylate cyclase class 2
MQRDFEVEQKYFVSDLPRLEQSLEKVGFRYVRTEVHCDTYFRHPCRDLRTTDEAFRLRRVDDNACVTYKGPRLSGTVKSRPEIELGIVAGEQEQWRSMLSHLGFEPLPDVRKTRRIFLTEERTVDRSYAVMLDAVETLGNFAEIESIVHDLSEMEQVRTEIEQLGACLGLTEIQPQSYLSQVLSKLGVE